MEPHEYPVSLVWKNGRLGEMTSQTADGQLSVATPPQFPGGIPNVWSPEHYFTAAVVGCYMTTFLAIAELSKLSFVELRCDSKGILDKVDGKFLMTKVILEPHLTVEREEDIERALRILEKSEKVCLISNSLKTEVELHSLVEVAQLI